MHNRILITALMIAMLVVAYCGFAEFVKTRDILSLLIGWLMLAVVTGITFGAFMKAAK